jgi:hypothetical protein
MHSMFIGYLGYGIHGFLAFALQISRRAGGDVIKTAKTTSPRNRINLTIVKLDAKDYIFLITFFLAK